MLGVEKFHISKLPADGSTFVRGTTNYTNTYAKT